MTAEAVITSTMSQPRAWFLAMRPKTLPAGLVPVAVGGGLAAATTSAFSWPHWFGCLIGALLIQIGVNFANDAFDALKGADTADRVGPQRAVASGLISARAMLIATLIVLLAALAVGLWLFQRGDWPILILGLISLVCAIAYTGGPFPLAYHGLGDLFVLLFFGLFAVLGTAWVQLAPVLAKLPEHIPVGLAPDMSRNNHWLIGLPWEWWAIATAIGLQAVGILCVNNLRDRDTDAAANKRTLAVRLGHQATLRYFAGLHIAATALWFLVALLWQPWLVVPAAIAGLGGLALSKGVSRHTGAALNPYLARSAALEGITGLSATLILSIV